MLSFLVRSTGPGLGLTVAIDHESRYHLEVPQEPLTINLHLPRDHDQPHVLSLEMWGKLDSYTVLDSQQKILADRWLQFTDFTYDGIQLGHLFTESARYYHDFNGWGGETSQTFDCTMHFNGRVEWLIDQDPLLWLLELT